MATLPNGRSQEEKDKLLKDAIAQVAKGNYNPLPVKPISSGLAASNGAADFMTFLNSMPTTSELSAEQRQLDKARRDAASRIVSGSKSPIGPDFMVKELERIAAGEKPDTGGIGGFLKDIVGKGLEGFGYVMNRPLAIVTSAGKEISDIASGQASFGDFFKQAIAKDTTPSKYLPKTGTKWLDQVIGFTADIALDPLTYVGFGATKWAGREGRLNLASFLAKEENLAKAPTVLKKLEDGSVGRLGIWALDADELKNLGMRRGLNWSFGAKNVIGKEGTLAGKFSEGAATAVGKPFAYGRAALGDFPLFTPLQKLTAKQAEKVAGLTMYGRRAADDVDVIQRLTQLASYNSAVKANASGRLLASKLGQNASQLVNDLVAHEEKGLRIHDVLEGLRLPADDAERSLAERTRALFDSTANTINETTAEFGLNRGTTPFLIERMEGYVPHVLSQEARDLMSSQKFAKSPWASSLKRSLGIGKETFEYGPGILQKRSLKTGDRFLGKKLATNNGAGFATLSEINEIALDKLKIKLFDDSAANYISEYINSAVNQVKRVAFADSLFDYGPDVIRAISPKVIGNKIVDTRWQNTLKAYDNIVTPVLDELSKTTQGVLGPRLALAQAVMSSAPGSKILSETQLSGVRTVLQQTMDLLKQSDDVVRNLDTETQAAYDAVSKPLRARLSKIEASIATGDEVELVKDLGLTDLYRRLYPDADVLPDAKLMAEDIVDGVQEMLGEDYSAGAIRNLENALKGAEGNLKGSATSAVNRLKSELDTLAATQPNDVAKISRVQKKLDYATNALDAEDVIPLSKQEWDQTVGKTYSNDIQGVLREVTLNPPKGPLGESTARWVQTTTKMLEDLNSPGLALSDAEREVMQKVFTQAKGLEAQIALLESTRGISEQALNEAFSQKNIGSLSRKILKGWSDIESLGVRMSPELRDQLFGKVAELGTAKGSNALIKQYKMYNKFFKVSAMLSPGFVARNGYTAAFNNFVFGVTPKETAEALRFATSVLRNGVDKALAKLPEELRSKYDDLLKMAYASGAGQTADDILGPIISKKGKKIVQGKIVGKWSQANEAMELAARFGMALSGANRGMNFEEIVGNIARFQFDYGNLSKLDEIMLGFIPFWTFASRNVALQLVNQAAQPKMYRMWESAQRNFPAEDQENMPAWLRERGPLQLPFLPKGMLLNLDLPQLDMADQIRMFTDPMRLLSQANPLVKLPIELMGNRQYWSNTPFSEKKSPVRGPWDFPAYALGTIFGDAGKNPSTGQYYTNAKAAYAAPNLLPPLAQLQRLLPEFGGKESYQDRAGSSRAAYFGLPFRRVSQDEQFNELTRRQFAIRDYLSRLTRTGYLEPKNGGG